jgi:hypothetical protein
MDTRKRSWIAKVLGVSLPYVTRIKAEPSVVAAITSYGNGSNGTIYEASWLAYIEGHPDKTAINA